MVCFRTTHYPFHENEVFERTLEFLMKSRRTWISHVPPSIAENLRVSLGSQITELNEAIDLKEAIVLKTYSVTERIMTRFNHCVKIYMMCLDIIEHMKHNNMSDVLAINKIVQQWEDDIF